MKERAVAKPQAAAGPALPRADIVRAFYAKWLHDGVHALRAAHPHLFSERHRHDVSGFGERAAADKLTDFVTVEEEPTALRAQLDLDARTRLVFRQRHRNACWTWPHRLNVI